MPPREPITNVHDPRFEHLMKVVEEYLQRKLTSRGIGYIVLAVPYRATEGVRHLSNISEEGAHGIMKAVVTAWDEGKVNG